MAAMSNKDLNMSDARDKLELLEFTSGEGRKARTRMHPLVKLGDFMLVAPAFFALFHRNLKIRR